MKPPDPATRLWAPARNRLRESTVRRRSALWVVATEVFGSIRPHRDAIHRIGASDDGRRLRRSARVDPACEECLG